MDRSRVAIVIPALNEERSIGDVVAAALPYGLPIVVDDGSADMTAEIARGAGAQVVAHATNCGYDAALNSGFRLADEFGCEFAITLDADGQHDPGLIAKFIERLDAGADVVVGRRSALQRFAEHCFSVLSGWLYGIEDPLCGLKGYRMFLYRKLGHFDSYNSIGTELTIYALRNGYRVEQLHIAVKPRQGTPRFGSGLRANLKILRSMIKSLAA